MSENTNTEKVSVKEKLSNWWNGDSFTSNATQVAALSAVATAASVAVHAVLMSLAHRDEDVDESVEELDQED